MCTAVEEGEVLGLGGDEIDTSAQPEVVIEESVVDIPMPEIGDLPARTIKVIMAPKNTTLEVMATVDQLEYLSTALSYHIDQVEARAAAAAYVSGDEKTVDDEIVSDAAVDEADEAEDADSNRSLR